ncbi:hypothetical protein QMK15_00860 [Campylobacter jejuni]|nr:hypothetical protein QMK15_00860 [Campylobacter jejuni]
MKKVVLISALLGAFAANVFAANTPSNMDQMNQMDQMNHMDQMNQMDHTHSKAKADNMAKPAKKTEEQTPAH